MVARWGELWQRGMLAPGTIRLWTAACVSPVDCGERPAEPGQLADAPRKRKLRPIACAECPLKLVEGAAIDAVVAVVALAFEPAQLGRGAADGAGVMVSLFRTWAEEEMEAARELSQGPVMFAGLDLENAYGRAYRSACVRGLRRRAPTLAPLAATQWSCDTVTAWQRADGAWRSSETRRGGWQGSRLTQSFCCGLEEGLEASVLFSHSNASADAAEGGPADEEGGADASDSGGDAGGSDSGRDDAPEIGLGRPCWVGRLPPVGPRQEGSTPAGGPTVWERAGRHRRKGRGSGAAGDGDGPGGGTCDAEHDGDLGSAGASGPGGTCWAGRLPPIGPRREGSTLAGGPMVCMVWEHAGRHGLDGRGPVAGLGLRTTRSTTATRATRSSTATWGGVMRWVLLSAVTTGIRCLPRLLRGRAWHCAWATRMTPTLSRRPPSS